MTESTSLWMILIAGPVRSGKSTLGRRIAERFDGRLVGFGDAVRQRTRTMELPEERGSWQQVGEDWVARDPEGLCDSVLAPTAGEALVVVDGVRHRSIYCRLRVRAAGGLVLVFVDADESVRRYRLALDGIGDEAIGQVLSHSTEAELPWLRDKADIVADGTRNATHVLIALETLITGDGQNNR